VYLFEPVAVATELTSGAGRCSAHPNKDAVAGCARCGAFVCDVCVTRTGETSLCPACFDTLHARGDLDTTLARRLRWDYLTLSLGVAGIIPWCGVAASPFAVALGCWCLWRRRREPWLSAGRAIFGMAIGVIFSALWIGVIAAGAMGKK
jgi:hypothetical protein